MRKITQLAVNAFKYGNNFSLDNTVVCVTPARISMHLHGNMIAVKNDAGLYISTAGWDTPTTKERLNGLNGVKVNTKKGQLYLNGKPWSGAWVKVDVNTGNWESK